MPVRIAALVAGLSALVLAPAAARAAAPIDRTVDRPAVNRLQARAAKAGDTIAVVAKEGYSVRVAFTPAVGVQAPLAASYVGFLDALPHGSELRKLQMLVAAPSQVAALCGGSEDEGILACYGGDSQMIVPSTGLTTTTPDGAYSTAYVLTHEYGHHVAANRDNAGFPAIDYGPKYWASYELVCDRQLRHLLSPGDEDAHYLENPGEAWAETYARLTFPDQPWSFTPLLRPDAGALAAARRDVLEPWTHGKVRRFRMSASRRTQVFRVALTLDGALRARVTGERGTNVGVVVRSGSQRVGASRTRGSDNVYALKAGCRERQTETISLRVTRSSGTGPLRLTVSYPG